MNYKKSAIRINLGGNYCGHQTKNPRLQLARPMRTGQNGWPRVLTLASERLLKYFPNPVFLPDLNQANSSSSQMRSERRESCILVMQVLLKYCDRGSLAFGVPKGDLLIPLSHQFIAKSAGLHVRRTYRALIDLKQAGFITTSYRKSFRDDKKKWFYLPSVRKIQQKFFRQLGLLKILIKEQKKIKRHFKIPFFTIEHQFSPQIKNSFGFILMKNFLKKIFPKIPPPKN